MVCCNLCITPKILIFSLSIGKIFSLSLSNRRVILTSIPPCCFITTLSTSSSESRAISDNLPPLQGVGGSMTRVQEIGGGFDITSQSQVKKGTEVIYPASMIGQWKCRRIITSIEGDVGQAEVAWRSLGGGASSPFKVNTLEVFYQSYIEPLTEWGITQNEYTFEGKSYKGLILDRKYELESRLGIYSSSSPENDVSWNVHLSTVSYKNNFEIAVVQRKIELPNEQGFGFDELYRITSSAGGATFGSVQRAVRVKRRYRRALDENNNRIVQGLEIMKTYRVLDGVAGIEMPTSTTKSQLILSRS